MQGAGHHISDIGEEAVGALRGVLGGALAAAARDSSAAGAGAFLGSESPVAMARGSSMDSQSQSPGQGQGHGAVWSGSVSAVIRSAFSAEAAAAVQAAQDTQMVIGL